MIKIRGDTHDQEAVQDLIHREGNQHQDVRIEGGIIPTVLVQRGGGVVRI
uniref:Uncharacterized protein n=1 Tax=Amphimedon queenslandica TaxID=400682 RepID=A0A1X7T4S5_AMPQE